MSATKKAKANFLIISRDNNDVLDYDIESYDEAVKKAKEIVEDGGYPRLCVMKAVATVTISPPRAEVEAL